MWVNVGKTYTAGFKVKGDHGQGFEPLVAAWNATGARSRPSRGGRGPFGLPRMPLGDFWPPVARDVGYDSVQVRPAACPRVSPRAPSPASCPLARQLARTILLVMHPYLLACRLRNRGAAAMQPPCNLSGGWRALCLPGPTCEGHDLRRCR